MLASGARASIDPNYQDDVPHVCVCGRKRLAMPRPSLSHPMRLQPPRASSLSLMWPEIVSRNWKLRSARVLRSRLASLTPLTTSVAAVLADTMLVERFTCSLRAAVGLSALKRSVSGGCSTRGPRSTRDLIRPLGSAFARLPHAQLVSS